MRGVPRPQQGHPIPVSLKSSSSRQTLLQSLRGQNKSTNSTSYKTQYKFCAQSLPMVGLTLQARKRKYGLSES
jgi:hypothetical protein